MENWSASTLKFAAFSVSYSWLSLSTPSSYSLIAFDHIVSAPPAMVVHCAMLLLLDSTGWIAEESGEVRQSVDRRDAHLVLRLRRAADAGDFVAAAQHLLGETVDGPWADWVVREQAHGGSPSCVRCVASVPGS